MAKKACNVTPITAGIQGETDAPETSAPSAIEAADMDYHRKVIANNRQAEQMVAQIEMIRGASISWMQHLQSKYGLSVGDQVDEHGQILRGGTAA